MTLNHQGGVMYKALVSISFFFAVNLASAQGINSIATFADKLNDIRGECSQMASELSNAVSMAELKNGSESRIRRLKTRQEVELFAIGNGRQQTYNYMNQRLQADSEADASDREQIDKQRAEGMTAVINCVEKALAQGKDLYSAIKRNKKIQESATKLMTAWIVNTKSISFYAPKGSQESKGEWEKAKAEAELSGL